ncbi:Gamma-butyrobetaine dioxygenase [Trichoplax sp. H2]|nr:Gamma-butyrobetaine dioxygenase [Trichoplax sp. H2]|eukprot:RDD36325.1 Gamma-butyrobetaine dioxygenase [Trichoplax sp. H2]
MHRLGKRLVRPLQQLFQSKQSLSRSSPISPLAFRKELVAFNSVAVENDIDNRQLHVKWDDGTTSRFPHIYLRDNCQCPNCFHPSAKQRNISDTSVLDAYDVDTKASQAQLHPDRQEIEIKWDKDNHVSVFDTNWLKMRRFPTDRDQVGHKIVYSDRRLWGGDLNGDIPTTDFNEILHDDLALYKWLKNLAKVGLTLVKNVPEEVGQVERLADRIAYLRVTNYGRTFTVKSKLDPSNLAFTDKGLALHTDLPYFDLVPGIQFLHCVQQAAGGGGENQFVDGFNVAEVLRKENPYYFDLLTQHAFVFFDIGNDYVEYNQLNHHPLITLNSRNEVIRFVHNNHARSSILDVPEDKVTDIYRAFRAIVHIMYDQSNLVTNKMESGEMVVFDNWRVLHGRSPFQLTAGGNRHLEGCFIDWDETTSRMRAIEEKQKMQNFTGVI